MLRVIGLYDNGRYRIEGEDGAKEYIVDPWAYQGRGWCNCPHFACRLEPLICRDPALEGEKYHCKHLRTFHYFASCAHYRHEGKKARRQDVPETGG